MAAALRAQVVDELAEREILLDAGPDFRGRLTRRCFTSFQREQLAMVNSFTGTAGHTPQRPSSLEPVDNHHGPVPLAIIKAEHLAMIAQ